jgi:hypothetical protein
MPEDSQEYLPSPLRTQGEVPSGSHSPLFTDLNPQAANFFFVRRCSSCEWIVVATVSTSPLYLFMSLQI